MAVKDYIISVNIPSIGNLPLKDKTASFKPDGVKRDHITAESKADGGYVESNTPATLTLTLTASDYIGIKALNEVKNENISIGFKSGKTHTMYNAWSTEVAEISNGEISCTFEANESEEV